MHACGHDTHTAMLLAAAEVLAGLRDRLPGKVVLLFQPAEEGVPAAEGIAGAERMIAEGALDDPKVDAVFGIHAFAGLESGVLGYRHGSMLAAGDRFEIVVQGRQAHGSKPWSGIDPIVAGSAIVTALQTLVSRESDLTHEPVVITVGQFDAGVRSNIIPDRARLVGTMRTFDEAMRADLEKRMRRMVERVAEGYGATAKVTFEPGYPVTANDARLRGPAPPDARAGGARAGARGVEDHGLGGLFALCPASTRGLPLPRHHPGGRAGHRGGQPLATVLRRRVGAPYRRACLRPGGRRLSLRACEGERKAE